MQTLDAIPQDSPQDPNWEAVNRLADALEHAEFIERVPSLQKPWGKAQHPLLTEYMRAALAVEYAKPVANVSIAAAKFYKECCEAALAACESSPSSLRVWVDMWAQAQRAHRDFVIIRAKIDKSERRTEIVRRFPPHKRRVRSV